MPTYICCPKCRWMGEEGDLEEVDGNTIIGCNYDGGYLTKCYNCTLSPLFSDGCKAFGKKNQVRLVFLDGHEEATK